MSKGPEKAPEPRRHRSKFKLQSIHVDELLSAAGMSGYLSVLEPLPESPEHLARLAEEMLVDYQEEGTAVPDRYREAVQKAETGTPEKGIPETDIRITGTPFSGIPVSVQPLDTAKEEPATESPTERGVPLSGIPSSIVIRKPTIRQAVLVQDGHSFGEQAVYQTLWDHAQPHDVESRLISIGYRTLSQLCHLTPNNCKANLIALSRKLAIKELSGHGPSQAKTYQVFSYNSILRQRRQAGLTHYIKTRGVAFVDAQTGQEINDLGIPVSGTPLSETGIPQPGSSGIPVSSTPSLVHLKRQRDSAASSSLQGLALLRTTLEDLVPAVDDDAISRLLYACLQRDPETTEDDIAYAIRLKSVHLQQGRIQNPLGFLLIAVPKLFEGSGLQRLRQWRQGRAVADGAALPDDVRQQLEDMASDPSSPADDRAFAQRVLNDLDRG